MLCSCVCNARDLERKGDGRESQHTIDGGNDLRLETKLVAEASSKVGDAALAVAGNVRCLPDVVEHVAAGKEQHSNQAECSPKVAVLQDRSEVGPGYGEKREYTKHDDGDGDNLDPVDRAGDGGLGSISGDLTRDPSVDLLGRLRAGGEVEADGLRVNFCVGAHGGVEEEEHGGGLEHHLLSVSSSVRVRR